MADGTSGQEAGFLRLEQAGNATRLASPISAEPASVLWIDEHLQPHYGPQRAVHQELRQRSVWKYRDAKQGFERQDYEAAHALARYAFTADERLWLALAIQAAVDELQGEPSGRAIIRQIAEELVDPEECDAKVEKLLRQSQVLAK